MKKQIAFIYWSIFILLFLSIIELSFVSAMTTTLNSPNNDYFSPSISVIFNCSANTERLCYQETANISTDCGGLDTGNYSFDSIGIISSELDLNNIIDGDWDTFYNLSLNGSSGEVDRILYINYSKPTNANNLSKWRTKTAPPDTFNMCFNGEGWYVCNDFNWTIPVSCWNQGVLQFKMISRLNNTFQGILAGCYNGTDWSSIFSFMGCEGRGCEFDYENTIYEEAMIWDMTNTTLTNISLYLWNGDWELNETQNVSGTYNNSIFIKNIPDGTIGWTCNAYDSDGNSAWDLVGRTLIVDTIFPLVSITYPENITYNILVSTLNYLFTEINLDSCWYSLDNGITNTSALTFGRGRGGGRGEEEPICIVNLTDLISNEGTNTWTVWINDTAGNENLSSVTFNYIQIYTRPEIIQPVFDLMDSAGAGLGIVITYISSSIFGLLVLIVLIAVFVIIGYAVASSIIEAFKNSSR